MKGIARDQQLKSSLARIDASVGLAKYALHRSTESQKLAHAGGRTSMAQTHTETNARRR